MSVVVVEVVATGEVMVIGFICSVSWESGAWGESLYARLCHVQAVKP